MPLWDMPTQPNQGAGGDPTAPEEEMDKPSAKILDKGILEYGGLYYVPGQYDPEKVDTGENPVLPDYEGQGFPTFEEALNALGGEKPQDFEYDTQK